MSRRRERECPKCGHIMTERINTLGIPYHQCGNCVAIAQQVYNHRKLSDAELDAKEARARAKYKRTMASIRKVRKERGL